MARKTVVDTAYTQINTNETSYLAQNISDSKVYVVINATLPALSTAHDFVLKGGDAIGSSDVQGLVWAKVEVGSPDVQMGIVEG